MSKLDLSTVITIVVLAVSLAGVYYTFEDRVDNLEKKVKILEKKTRKNIQGRRK